MKAFKKAAINFLISLAIAAVAIFIYGIAGAGDISYTRNTAGGYIWFTDSPCQMKQGYLTMYSTGKGGIITFGCWTMFEGSDNVFAVWEDGQTRVYDMKYIHTTDYGENKSKKNM